MISCLCKYQVEIIITTYKRYFELERCICSILNQSYKFHTITVISDGFDNQVQLIVDKFKNIYIGLHYKYSSKHEGRPSILRNIGINQSNSDFICFCDDDDYWHPSKLELQIKRMISGNYHFCSTNAIVKCKTKSDRLFNPLSNLVNIKYSLLFRSKIILSSVMIRTELLKKHNFPVTSKHEYNDPEDFYLWVNIFFLTKHFKFTYINNPLVYYSLSSDSIRKKSSKLKFILIYYHLLKVLIKCKRPDLIILTTPVQFLKITTDFLGLRNFFSRV